MNHHDEQPNDSIGLQSTVSNNNHKISALNHCVELYVCYCT